MYKIERIGQKWGDIFYFELRTMSHQQVMADVGVI